MPSGISGPTPESVPPKHVEHQDEPDWVPATARHEWELMYVRGMSIIQIAEVCRVDNEPVRRHIRARERDDPSIFGRRLIRHTQPAPPPSVVPSPLSGRRDPGHVWEARFEHLRRFMEERGQYPQQLSPDPDERKLFGWLGYQRDQDRDGRLSAERAAQLDTLGSWRGRALGDRETHWRNTHTKLLQFIQDAGRLPSRYNPRVTPEETALDVWLAAQRANARRGELPSSRRAALDDTMPNWNQIRASRRSD